MASNTFIIKDVRIFDGEIEILNGYIHVEDGKVKTVGSNLESTFFAPDIKIVSKPGHTVIPGLIDAHNHCDKGNEEALYQALRFGVTTSMDLHNEIPNCQKLKKIAREEGRLAADFKCAGVAATIDNGWPEPVVTAHDKSPEVWQNNPNSKLGETGPLTMHQTLAEVASWPKLKTEADVKAYIKQNIADGADYIKLMHESGSAMGVEFKKPSIELQTLLIDEAHANGKVAIAHCFALADTVEMLNAGIDGMAHTFFDAPPTEELIAAYKRRNAWLCPTLAVIGSFTAEGNETAERFAHDTRIEGKISEKGRENLCRCMNFKKESSRAEYAYESVRQLKAAGIDIIW